MRIKLAMLIGVIMAGLAFSAYTIMKKPETEQKGGVIAVKNLNGELVGIVSNALVDSSGNIAFIIVRIKGLVAKGERQIVVPAGIFAYDARSNTLLLNMSKEQLALSPEFKESDMNDPGYLGEVYRYYGLVPPWSDTPTERGKEDSPPLTGIRA